MRMNLKICLPLLLLFFLFLDRSASAGPYDVLKIIAKAIKNPLEKSEKPLKGSVDVLEEVFKKADLGSPATSCTHTIKRLSLFKKYLSKYGYMDNSDPFTDCFDSKMVSAIKSYQQFFKLSSAGNVEGVTKKQLLLLRCAVPDRNVTYHLSTASNDDMSWPNGTEWFANRRSLTYGFHPSYSIPPRIKKVFSDSFQRWSDAVKVLNLTETNSFDRADIKIGFYNLDNTIGGEVVGGTVVRDMHGNSFGVMFLDATKYVLLQPSTHETDSSSWENEKVDLGTVVMHQIGHLLGLSHSSDVDSVMHPYVSVTRKTVKLSDGDLQQIQRLYSSSDDKSAGGGGVASNHEDHSSGDGGIVIGSSWGLLTTLSLGFSAVVLFY